MRFLDSKAWIMIIIFLFFSFLMLTNRSLVDQKVDDLLLHAVPITTQPMQQQKLQCDAIKEFKKSPVKKISQEEINRLFFQSQSL